MILHTLMQSLCWILSHLGAGYPHWPLCRVPGLGAETQFSADCARDASLEHGHCHAFAGDTGVPVQLSHRLTLLPLSLAGFSAPHCVFSAPLTLLHWLVPPTWCAGAGIPLGLAQQLAQPHKPLSCKF